VRATLVSIPTDTQPLDGVFYEPASGAIAGAVLLFHGNTMNFYVGAPRFLPPRLTQIGFACLAFNRRGHDILGIRDSRAAEGAAFQTTREAIADNRTAAEWLVARGFPHPVVVGHSNGGLLAVRHAADHSATPALVLARIWSPAPARPDSWRATASTRSPRRREGWSPPAVAVSSCSCRAGGTSPAPPAFSTC